MAFRRHFPGATVVRLEVNYRSTPEILRAAAAVLPRRERVKRLPTAAGASGPLPTVTSYATDADEARGVARALRSLHGPDRPWRAMAVLYRINAQSVRFEEALRAAGIPFRVRGGARFLDRPEIVGALEQLRASERRAPGLPFAAHLSDLAAHGRGDDDGDVATDDPDDDRQAVRRELVRLGHEYLAAEGPPGSFDGFRGYLASVFADDLAPPGDAVELLSFHRAKGLEWPAVFVTGLERGLVPIAYADTPAALSEERRLVYVAMSRAASDLRLSWAQRRTLGDRDTPRRPSPYLIPINAVLTGQPSETPPRRRPRAGLAAARAAGGLGPAGDADPTVLSALVEWRRGLARVNGIPAFVIFHDATLAAVAEAKPRNHRDLLALPGIGPVKVERYGDAVLDVVRRHAS
jgi:DNA helicase-2/ATP-dependent DNA helicase PcrA